MLIPRATEHDNDQYRAAMLAQANQERLGRSASRPSSGLSGSTGELLVRVGDTLTSWGQSLQHRAGSERSYHLGRQGS